MRKPVNRNRFNILLALLAFTLLSACRVESGAPAPATDAPEQVAQAVPEIVIPPTFTAGPESPPDPVAASTTPAIADTTAPDLSPTSTPQQVQLPSGSPTNPLFSLDIKNVRSVDVVAVGQGTVIFAFGSEQKIFLMRSFDGGATFSKPLPVSGETAVFMHNIERPSLTVDAEGYLGLAWLADHKDPAVWYSESFDFGETMSAPRLVVKAQGEGTWLPRVAAVPGADPLVSWIQAGKLAISRLDSGAADPAVAFIDPQVCDCCPAFPAFVDGGPNIVYRDLEVDAQGRTMRNISMLAFDSASQSFREPVQISDAPWFLDFCPTSGPVLAAAEDEIYVAWMDGRDNALNSLEKSDIWFSMSNDGGRSFSANMALNQIEDAYHNKPTMAVGPDGRIHVAWEAEQADRAVIFYTLSDDGGRSFAVPTVVFDRQRGVPGGVMRNVRLSVDDAGRVYMVWMDNLGAHIRIW